MAISLRRSCRAAKGEGYYRELRESVETDDTREVELRQKDVFKVERVIERRKKAVS